MRKIRAKLASEKVVTVFITNLVDDIVQKKEKQKAKKEVNRKRKALERENETAEEKNYRLDRDMENKRNKSQALFDQVYQWCKRRGTLKSSQKKIISQDVNSQFFFMRKFIY